MCPRCSVEFGLDFPFEELDERLPVLPEVVQVDAIKLLPSPKTGADISNRFA